MDIGILIVMIIIATLAVFFTGWADLNRKLV